MKNETMSLNEKLAVIQTEFKAKKSRFNSFGKYNFRSAEDILEATKPFLQRLNVSVVVTEELIQSNFLEFPMLKSTATISGSYCNQESPRTERSGRSQGVPAQSCEHD